MGPIQLNCNRGSTSQLQATASQSQSQMKSYVHHQQQRQVPPDSQAQPNAEHSRQGQCQGKLPTSKTLQQDLSHTAVDRDVMSGEIWEERRRVEEARGQRAAAESRELHDEELQQGRREQSPVQQQQPAIVPPAAELRKEQQRNRPALMLKDHRDGRVRA